MSNNQVLSNDDQDYEFQVFEEDVVSLKDDPTSKKTGIVKRVGNKADESDFEDSDDEEEFNNLNNDDVMVSWEDGNDSVHKIKQLEVIDRSFIQGDVIAKKSDPLGMSGTIVDVNLVVDTELIEYTGTVRKVEKVNAKRLQYVHPFVPDNLVVYNDWICNIDDCHYDLTITFKDGSVCVLGDVDPEISCEDEEEEPDDVTPFFPNQELFFIDKGRAKLLKDAKWIKGSYKRRIHKQGKVTEVKIPKVDISFIISRSGDQPPENTDESIISIEAAKLQTFSYFRYANVEVTDVVIIPKEVEKLSESERMSFNEGEEKSKSEQIETPDSKDTKEGNINSDDDDDEYVSEEEDSEEKNFYKIRRNRQKYYTGIIVGRKTTVNVLWQNGVEQTNVSSTELVPLHHIGDNDFHPEDIVKSKQDEDDEQDNTNSQKVGSIKTVDYANRTCTVKWLNKNEEDQTQDNESEEFSVYQVETHPDYEYRLGDVVLLLPDNETQGKSKDWVGEIIAMNEGKLKVMWLSGNTSEVDYDKVLCVDKIQDEVLENDEMSFEDGSDGEGVDSQIVLDSRDLERMLTDAVDAAQHLMDDEGNQNNTNENEEKADEEDEEGWETVSEESDLENNGLNNNENGANNIGNVDLESLRERGIEIPSEILERLESINSSMQIDGEESIGYKRSYTLPEYTEDEEIKKKLIEKKKKEEEEKDISKKTKASSSSVRKKPKTNVKIEQNISPELKKFPKFETVSDCSDHSFNNMEKNVPRGKTLTKIRKEWKMLSENLPDGIFVRAYEERMDILRAIVVGPSQTPYYDGIVVFDLYLPQSYPHHPPKCHFWSYGHRINPNLYADGKVCLSLLGTWEGKDNCEVWNAESSNIFQLLVSLVGLVLVTEPYYNEAGYERQIGTKEGEHNSIAYNENALLLMMSYMTKSIKSPPSHCKEIINTHFKSRGKKIMERFEKYLVSKTENNNNNSEENKFDENGISSNPSKGFILTLKSKYNKLKKELEELQ